MKKSILFICLCFFVTALFAEQPRWIWIHGTLSDPAEQSEYMKLTDQLIRYYGQGGTEISKISEETSRIKSYPDTVTMVWCGPVRAFSHLEEAGFPVTLENKTLKISGLTLKKPRTGLFLSLNAGKRILFTGLDYQGFNDIFTIPTGNTDCTVMENGRKTWEGGLVDGKLALKPVHFLPPFPTEKEIRELIPPSGSIDALTIFKGPGIDKTAELQPDFWEWFLPQVKDMRALVLGESHWNLYVMRFFQVLISGLSKRVKVNGVLFELNYSFSGHFNHYVHLSDDTEARAFKDKYLSTLVSMEGTMEILESIRISNKQPAVVLSAGCHDLEWNHEPVIVNIVYPYVKLLEPQLSIYGRDLYEPERYRALLDKLSALVTNAKPVEIKELPFLKKDFLLQVLQNLKDTLESDDSFSYRHRIIQRNQTVYCKKMFDDQGMVLLHVGNLHAEIRDTPGRDYLTDAQYLDQVFPPTRGKVFSLRTEGIGYEFTPLNGVDLSKRKSTATRYLQFAREYLVTDHSETTFLLSGNSQLNRVMIGYSSQAGGQAFGIRSIDWKKLTPCFGQSLNDEKDYFERFDAHVFIIRSPIDLPGPR